LFWKYLRWATAKVEKEFEISLDIATIIEQDMNTLDKLMPPKGRLMLGYVENQLAGIACLKTLTDRIGEVKRM
jgi:hypothetical protein